MCMYVFRFRLTWYEKLKRRATSTVMNTAVGRRVSLMVTRKTVGIRRADSKNFGRQISWSWNNNMVKEEETKIKAKVVVTSDLRQVSRGYSRGMSREVIRESALGRGISRGISRGFSRGLSTDSIFDPSGYNDVHELPPVSEEEKHADHMKASVVHNVPSKQQVGERPGTQYHAWSGKIFSSRDNIEVGESDEESSEKGSMKRGFSRGGSFADWLFKKQPSKVIPIATSTA